MSQVQRDQLKVAAERAVLVGVHLPGSFVDSIDPFRELRSLATTAGAMVVGELIQKRTRPRGATYLGKGKVEELAELVRQTKATLVIFDNDLSPAQVKNLEAETRCKIIDRSELILDIFANRAATHAAKLQVEIAQLEYTYPRLRAMWDHLGQVTGGAPVGIGTRGPGEQQLEIDRRLVQRRLGSLKRELAEIQQRKTREVSKRNVDHATLGLVGYTNAGKSTLFNRLTAGGAYAHDKLFATLSTRVERWELGGGVGAMLSDTVGFIRDLPHRLVASFRSTLEETVFADALLIVLDVSDHEAEMQLETVYTTLDDIGAIDQPRLLLLNKIDRLERGSDLLAWLNRHPDAIPVSAHSGEGLDELTAKAREIAVGSVREVEIAVPLSEPRAITFLERRTEVLDRRYDEADVHMRVRIGRQVDELLASGAPVNIDGRRPADAVKTVWDESAAPRAYGVPPHLRFWHS